MRKGLWSLPIEKRITKQEQRWKGQGTGFAILAIAKTLSGLTYAWKITPIPDRHDKRDKEILEIAH